MKRWSRDWACSLILSLALVSSPVVAQGDPIPEPDPNTLKPSQDPARKPNGLAMTPPMGWNSWNKFGCNINEQIVREMTDAMVSSGMRDAGYRYVIIDDGWHGDRDAYGFITADRKKFPSGIAALANYIHSKGLKFGIYSDAGR